jgi:hypothetical protein
VGEELVGEEEECVSRKDFLVELNVAFCVYACLGMVGFEFDDAVNVLVIEGGSQLSMNRCWGSSGLENRYIDGR